MCQCDFVKTFILEFQQNYGTIVILPNSPSNMHIYLGSVLVDEQNKTKHTHISAYVYAIIKSSLKHTLHSFGAGQRQSSD